MCAYQGRDANDVDVLPLVRDACHADADVWPGVWVRVEVRDQYGANSAFRLHLGVGGGIDRYTGHVGAHGAAGFGFNDNRIVHRHSTPASRRMRLPNRPASFLV